MRIDIKHDAELAKRVNTEYANVKDDLDIYDGLVARLDDGMTIVKIDIDPDELDGKALSIRRQPRALVLRGREVEPFDVTHSETRRMTYGKSSFDGSKTSSGNGASMIRSVVQDKQYGPVVRRLHQPPRQTPRSAAVAPRRRRTRS